MGKIIAVVVTYNRQKLLSECIHALRSQTRSVDQILVVNNGSTDNTEYWLQQQSDVDFVTQSNVGSGGGFNTGIKLAYEKGFDWIWLMDDDGYPKEDALEKLLENDSEELCLRNCAVINKEDKKSFVWKTANYNNIDEVKDPVIKNFAHPFNGTLLHKKIIKKVGLPRKELFIWGDETEYFYRIINKHKIPFYTKANSIHYHPASAYSFKDDWNYTNNWKMYYYVRNRFFILKSKYSKNAVVALTMYIGFLIAFSGVIITFQKTHKFKKLSFIFWPMKDAFTNNYLVTPSVILNRLSTKNNYQLSNYFSEQKNIFKGFISKPVSPTLHKLKKA
ncbi:MAG: glycosyltransferase family 2 protein [Bacteroidota bacterium]|jgi:rhamnopyranosyl-N-acetylglucosaminyl-diphospho-decaprenol beta-1,3/1,4-galactofuranosyltransferase|nr:glycosyltransferase family 2 protein [Bacteroidota bacterium]